MQKKTGKENELGDRLTRLEEQYRDLTKIKVDKMLGFVCHVAAKVAADNAVPSRVVLPVKFFLDVRCNVFFNRELVQSRGGHIDGIELHFLRHIRHLNHRLSVFRRHSFVVVCLLLLVLVPRRTREIV